MLSKSARTKQLIVEKAAPIFNKKGFAATTMSDILNATTLGKGSLYSSFESKEALALGVFEYLHTQLRDAIWSKIKVAATATAKLEAIFAFYHNYTIEPVLEGGCPILNTAVDADFIFPELKAKAASASKEMLNSLAHIINNGIARGEFHEKIDAKAEANLIFSVMEGGMMMSKLHDDPAYLNNLLHQLKLNIQKYKR